jgi:hypothetical protein
MLCLVCEKKIPLHRQLAGSPFCSREHGEQHGAEQRRPSSQAKSSPPAAKFVSTSLACAVPAAQPDATAFRTPIPRFCGVILCRRHPKPRYTRGVPSAPVIKWLPDTAAPETAHAIDGGPQAWNRLHLGVDVSSPLYATLRLSTAPHKQGAQAIQPPPERVPTLVDGILRTMPWDACFRTRWPGARCPRSKLVIARAFLPVLTLSNVVNIGVDACGAPFVQELAKRAFPPSRQLAALPLAGYSCESLQSANSGSQPAASLGASTSEGVLLPKLPPVSALIDAPNLSPRIGLFEATNLQALRGVGESFTLADMESVPRVPEPLAPCPGLMLSAPALADRRGIPYLRAPAAKAPDLSWSIREPGPEMFEAAPFQCVLAIIEERGKPDISEFEFVDFFGSAAGFAIEEWPAPLFGVFRPLYDSCDFSLQPVWLASLFILAHPLVGWRLRAARDSEAIRPAALFNNVPAPGNGPGFSGMLAFPKSDAPAKEFGEQQVRAAARPPASRDVRRVKNPWQAAVLLWHSVPGFARGLAMAIPLIAPAIFFAPTIRGPHLPFDEAGLMEVIQARAEVNLREDFQAGLGAWTGPKGWESTWKMDSPGAAQPGRMALYQPQTPPLTDYRVEVQGQILSKALGFVFRATDLNNYHAAKITIRKPGPLPTAYLVRYAVIKGRADQKTETLLPMYLRSDTLYDVLVTIQGDNFTITVNGQLVDTWSDSRLKSGGVGLFADKGEISQVRSVHVTENEGFLGWLCSQVSHWNADRARIGVKHE